MSAPTPPRDPFEWSTPQQYRQPYPPPPPGAPLPRLDVPPSRPPRKKTKRAILIVSVVVVGIAIRLGVAVEDAIKHEAKEAEVVVKDALEANTVAEIRGDFAGSPRTIFADGGCASSLSSVRTGTKYWITTSHKNDDGSATVEVTMESPDVDLEFHLVQQADWKIDHITCSGPAIRAEYGGPDRALAQV